MDNDVNGNDDANKDNDMGNDVNDNDVICDI